MGSTRCHAKDKAKILASRTLAVNHTNILGDSDDPDDASSDGDDDSPDTSGESTLNVNSTEVKTDNSPDSSSTQVNAAKSNAHPADVRRVLGGSPKPRPPGRKANTVSWRVDTTQWTVGTHSRSLPVSAERGEDDGEISTSQSEPPFANPHPDDDDEDELDRLFTSPSDTPTVASSTSVPMTSPDPYGLQSLWEEDDSDFY